MTKITNGKLNTQLNKGNSAKTKFVITESYKGVKSLSAIFKDIVLSELHKKNAG